MSFHVYFGFSVGIKCPLLVPEGTTEKAIKHVQHVEATLGLKTIQYKDNPPRWGSESSVYGVEEAIAAVESDELVCKTVAEHNHWVRRLYETLQESTPAEEGAEVPKGKEVLSPEVFATFFHGTQMLDVPVHRWTREYYTEQMETCYEVMRGRPTNGISLSAAKLTEKQAAAVITLFAEFLDAHDCRLDVPHGRDYLASSYDGGYTWCDGCHRPIADEDRWYCKRSAKRCPLKDEEDDE